MGSQIGIVDHIRSFACETLLLDWFAFDSDSVIQKKRKEVTSSKSNAIPQVRWATGSSKTNHKKLTLSSVK